MTFLLQDCSAVFKNNLLQANGRGSIGIDASSVPLQLNKVAADNRLDVAPVLL